MTDNAVLGAFYKILPTAYAEACALPERDLLDATLLEIGREATDTDSVTMRSRLAARRAWRAARTIAREVERLAAEVTP